VERQSIALIAFSVFLGGLIGSIGLLSAFYILGYFSSDAQLSPPETGMTILNNYTCRKAETKQLILGGVEDYFDPDGHEPSNPNEKLINFIRKHNSNGQVRKTYDQRETDLAMSDQFDVPKRTYHGIVAVRLEELSSLKNDSIRIGYNTSEALPYVEAAYGYGQFVSDMETSTAWQQYETLFVASLDNLPVTDPSSKFVTVLDVIRSRGDDFGDMNVQISDDTMVDFVGFALCLEPKDHKGTVSTNFGFGIDTIVPELGLGNIYMRGAYIDDKFCSYGGCLSCEASRPVSCINDKNYPIPQNGHPSDYERLWSGGKIAFTKAVLGSSFKTEDEVDQFCATEFGAEWRALSRHDGGWDGSLTGIGEFPSGFENVWINVKSDPHANCWELRPDYEAQND